MYPSLESMKELPKKDLFEIVNDALKRTDKPVVNCASFLMPMGAEWTIMFMTDKEGKVEDAMVLSIDDAIRRKEIVEQLDDHLNKNVN